MFAVGIACGSLGAAQLSHERPNVALVPLGAIVMGIVGLDLALAIGRWTASGEIYPAQFAFSFGGARLLLDFFLFAVGGGLFVVPSFAAVQAWSAPAERARVIAAGNVMGAAFMVTASLAVARLAGGRRPRRLVARRRSRSRTSLVCWFVVKTWGEASMRDLGALLFKLLFRVEVRGLENLPPAGTRMLITPNHGSLIDGPLLHAVLPIDAAFAVDTGIAQGVVGEAVHEADPRTTRSIRRRPLATRDLVHLVARGEPLVIFPEGRVTVTGSLMKVYDGAAMIADKGDAVVVPVRIDGAQRSHFGYLRSDQIKRVWFPKITIYDPAAGQAEDRGEPARQDAPHHRGRGAAGRHDRHHRQDRDARPHAVRGPRSRLAHPRHRQADHRRSRSARR